VDICGPVLGSHYLVWLQLWSSHRFLHGSGVGWAAFIFGFGLGCLYAWCSEFRCVFAVGLFSFRHERGLHIMIPLLICFGLLFLLED